MTAVANNRNAPRGRTALPRGRGIAIAALVLVLAGCNATGRRDVAGWRGASTEERHPIVVDRKEVVLDIAVPAGSYGMTHAQKNDLAAFIRRFKQQDSGGILVVRAPNGSRNEIAVMRALDDVRRVAASAGIAPKDAAFETYYAGRVASAPIRVSFMRHVAVGPECGEWPRNVGRDPKNMVYQNFGCATQRNLAAMVANPRDLVEPRGMTPRSSERRDTVWEKYVKGETTIADKDEEEKSQVSEIQGGG